MKIGAARQATDSVTGELTTFVMGGGVIGKGPAVQMASIRARAGSSTELAALYRASVTYVGTDRVFFCGLERLQTANGVCWVAQSWECELAKRV